MHGQTTHMHKTLVDAYRAVLVRMRQNNRVLPVAMIMALCAGGSLAGRAQAATLTWQGTNATGGSNTWDTNNAANPNWLSGSTAATWTDVAGDDTALFNASGAVGTVTVSAGTVANALDFSAAGYTLNGGDLTLTGALSAPAIAVNANATIATALSGTAGFTMTGAGQLVLSADNTALTGAVLVTSGSVQLGHKDGLAGAELTLSAGTVLDVNGQSKASVGLLMGDGNVTLNGGNLTVSTINTDAAYSGVISGTGDVTKHFGPNVWTLAADQTFTGTLTIKHAQNNGGGVELGTGGTTGSVAGPISMDEYAALLFNHAEDVATPGFYVNANEIGSNYNTGVTGTAIFVNKNDLVTTRLDGQLTIGALYIGGGAFTVTNTGNTLGGIVVAKGTLVVNALGALGTGTVKGTSDGALVLAGSFVFSNDIIDAVEADLNANFNTTVSGYAANLTIRRDLADNPVSVILTGTNTYTGTTTLDAGNTLQVGNGGTLGTVGTGTVSLGDGSALIFNRSDALTVAPVIFGTGTITQAGGAASEVTLSGLNTYTGATVVASGTLKAGVAFDAIAAAGAFGTDSAVTVVGGATLDIAGFDSQIGSLAGAGSVINSDAPATLTTGGDNTSTLFSGSVTDGAGVLSLRKTGTGTQTLSTAAYTGVTVVEAGALVFTAPSTTLGQVMVFADGRLAVGDGTGGINSRVLSIASAANDSAINVRRDARLNLAAPGAYAGAGTLANAGTLGVTGAVKTTNALSAEAGSVLLLADGNASMDVSSLTIAPGARIAAESLTGFTIGVQNVVVHSAANISGTFTVDAALSAAPPASNIRWVSGTIGQDALLGLRYYVPTPANATPQERAIINGLNDAIRTTPDLEAESQRLSLASDSVITSSIDSMGGHDRAATEPVLKQHAHARGQGLLRWAQSNLINGETAFALSAPAARATSLADMPNGPMNEEPLGLRFFVKADHATETRDAQASGALASTASGNVFTVGIHNQLSDDMNIGAVFTYDMTEIKSGGGLGKADVRTYGADVYLSKFMDEGQRLYLAADLGLGKSSSDNERYGITPANLTATSTSKGMEYHASGEVGYRAPLWQDAQLTPYAGISYVRNNVDAYQESLPASPGLALGYAQTLSTSTQTTLGAELKQAFQLGGGYVLTPAVSGAWHHQLRNGSNIVDTYFSGASNTVFSTYLGAVADDAVEVGAKLLLQAPGGAKAFVNARTYRAMGSTADGHQNSMGAGLQFDF